MDGRGRAKDNIRIERFWKTLKYEYIYIRPEENGTDLFFGIKRLIDDYNSHRRHQGTDAASERTYSGAYSVTFSCLTLTWAKKNK